VKSRKNHFVLQGIVKTPFKKKQLDTREKAHIDFRFKVLGSINRKSSTFVRTFALSSLSSTFIKLKAPNLYNFSKFVKV